MLRTSNANIFVVINVRNCLHGETLMHAALSGSNLKSLEILKVLEYLLKHGGDFFIADSFGYSAFDLLTTRLNKIQVLISLHILRIAFPYSFLYP